MWHRLLQHHMKLAIRSQYHLKRYQPSYNSLANPFFLEAFNNPAVKRSGSSTILTSAELCQVHTVRSALQMETNAATSRALSLSPHYVMSHYVKAHKSVSMVDTARFEAIPAGHEKLHG